MISLNNHLKFCIYVIISSEGVLKEYFVSSYSFYSTFHWIHVKTSTSYIILFDMGKLSHLMGNWKNQFCTYHFFAMKHWPEGKSLLLFNTDCRSCFCLFLIAKDLHSKTVAYLKIEKHTRMIKAPLGVQMITFANAE